MPASVGPAAPATFAATSNPVTISGISLASSDVQVLQVYDFGASGQPGNGFSNTTSDPGANGQGINLDLVPQVDSAKQVFYLSNTSADNLQISASASQAGTSTLDPNDVQVTFWDDAATPNQCATPTTLEALESGNVQFSSSCNMPAGTSGDSNSQNLTPSHPGNYQVSFELLNPTTDFDTLSGLTLQFTGTPAT